jgi:hypothetical protein
MQETPMPDSGRPSDEVRLGDRVAYRLSPNEPANEVQGKVIGLFLIQNGQILADVEWDRLGPPKRLAVTNLLKA